MKDRDHDEPERTRERSYDRENGANGDDRKGEQIETIFAYRPR